MFVGFSKLIFFFEISKLKLVLMLNIIHLQVANKVVSIDGYENVDISESALLCAVVNQPVTVALQGSTFDFQLYYGVSIY